MKEVWDRSLNLDERVTEGAAIPTKKQCDSRFEQMPTYSGYFAPYQNLAWENGRNQKMVEQAPGSVEFVESVYKGTIPIDCTYENCLKCTDTWVIKERQFHYVQTFEVVDSSEPTPKEDCALYVTDTTAKWRPATSFEELRPFSFPCVREIGRAHV